MPVRNGVRVVVLALAASLIVSPAFGQPVSEGWRPTRPAAVTILRAEVRGPEFVVPGAPVKYSFVAVTQEGELTRTPRDIEWSLTPPEAGEMAADGTLTLHELTDVPLVVQANATIQNKPYSATIQVRTLDNAPLGSVALQFDGHGGTVRVPGTEALRPAEFTISAWARLDGSQSQNARLVRQLSTLPDGKPGGGFVLGASQAGAPHVCFHANGVRIKDTRPNSFYEGRWHHYAAVYSASRAALYIDGREVAAQYHTQGPMRWEPHSDMFIGFEEFRGAIEDVRFWKRPLTPEEIAQAMTALPEMEDRSLIASWRLNDAAGNVARDAAAGLHGVATVHGKEHGVQPKWVAPGAPR
jgi:hypothetical protein